MNNFQSFYFFPINGNNRDNRLLSKDYFFGDYICEKVIDDLKSDKCVLHINWLDEPYIYDEEEVKRLNNFLYENEISWENILFTSNNNLSLLIISFI